MDQLIKVIGIVLLTSTLIAFVLCLFNGPINNNVSLFNSLASNKKALLFLIPLMGWMPTAIDLSSWNSLWTVEKIKSSNYHPSLKETLFEFNFGYIIPFIINLFFNYGAFLLFGTENTISSKVIYLLIGYKSIYRCFWPMELYNNCIHFSIMLEPVLQYLMGMESTQKNFRNYYPL